MLALSSAAPRVCSLIGLLCRSISSYVPYISYWRTSIAVQRLWIKQVHFLCFCLTFPAVDHVARMNEPHCTYECVMSRIWMRHIAHINASFRLWTQRESPKLHTSSHVSKRNPRHSKDLPGNWVDLQIRIFGVWSPSWGAHKLETVLCFARRSYAYT